MPTRRKPRGARKEKQIRVLMTGAQKAAIETAAKRAALAPATWVRVIALREALGRG